MPAGSLDALDTAIFSLLNGNVTDHEGSAVPVLGDVDDATAFPYITVGEATEIPWNSLPKNGKEVTLTIHVWSQYYGFYEATKIAESIDGILDNRPLAIAPSGWKVSRVENEMTDRMREPDGITRRVVLRYRLFLEPN